jgi:DNA repair protein RadC
MEKTMPLFELRKNQTEFQPVKILSSDAAYNLIKNFYSDDIEILESCFILLLNNASKAIGYAKISQGGITGTVIDVRIVAKYAVDSLATSVILAHNHPSGNLKPSQADISITEKVKNALALLDIKLIEHLILTVDGFYSFADEGHL